MLKLTAADMAAISKGDSEYINGKGAKYYSNEEYKMAVEYYHIGASMGNVDSISNLGCCYLMEEILSRISRLLWLISE